jgi:hypothetical protein
MVRTLDADSRLYARPIAIEGCYPKRLPKAIMKGLHLGVEESVGHSLPTEQTWDRLDPLLEMLSLSIRWFLFGDSAGVPYILWRIKPSFRFWRSNNISFLWLLAGFELSSPCSIMAPVPHGFGCFAFTEHVVFSLTRATSRAFLYLSTKYMFYLHIRNSPLLPLPFWPNSEPARPSGILPHAS